MWRLSEPPYCPCNTPPTHTHKPLYDCMIQNGFMGKRPVLSQFFLPAFSHVLIFLQSSVHLRPIKTFLCYLVCLWPSRTPDLQPLSRPGQSVNRMPMEGASRPRFTWYLAHTPTATPTEVPIGPLKPPHLLLLLSGGQLALSVSDSQEWRMLLLMALAHTPPCWVNVMCMFSVLPSLFFVELWAVPSCLSLISVWTRCAPLKFWAPGAPSSSPCSFDSLYC